MTTRPDDQSTERSALASPGADVRELKANSSATVEELQGFLRQLKGKSPQEMLGVVAASHLFRSCILATILVFAGIAVGTVLPFALGAKDEPAKPAVVASATPEPRPAPEPAPEPDPVPEPDLDAPSTLGVDETKTAPPDVNPLENKKDDFLKDLE